jgi:autotransporter-associated beta strand protein
MRAARPVTQSRKAYTRRGLKVLAAAACAYATTGSAALAVTGTWTTAGGGNYSLTTNWSGGTVPNAIDDIADFGSVDLAANSTVTLDIATTLGGLTFGDTNTVTAGSWTIGPATAGDQVLTLATSVGAPTLVVNALGTGSTVTIGIPVAGTQGFTKDGVGTLIFTRTNTFSGDMTINAGTLQFGNGGASGSPTTGNIVNNGTLIVNRNNAENITGNVSGSGNVIKNAVGLLTMLGTNTYGGTTAINSGQINFATPAGTSGLANGSITVAGAGGIQNGTTSITDATFLSKINTASTGAFGINTVDAAQNFDFTSGPFAAFANMSIGVVSGGNFVYSGTVTPAASTYRFGGSGGTIQLDQPLGGANSLVANAGRGNAGTVILNGANTYSGTTTIASGTLQIGTGGTTGVLPGGAVTNNGTIAYFRSDNITIANTITGTGILQKSGGGTASITGSVTGSALNVTRGTAAGNTVQVDGGSVTMSALSTVGGASFGGTNAPAFILNSGSATFNGGIRSDTNDASIIRVTGGTFSATDVQIRRNSGASTATTTGFNITGGTANVGTIRLGTDNSWGHLTQSGGTLNATGAITVGNQTSGSRGGVINMSGGVFNSTDTVSGIIMGRKNGTNNNVAIANFSGGVSTVNKFSMGFDAVTDGGSGTITVSGTGQLYIGSGGIVKNATGTYASNLNVTSTTALLGAAADHTVDGITIGLNAASITVKAADASNVAHNMTWAGTVAGTGNLVKTGGGILDLQGSNTWTGGATVNAGTLAGKASSLRGNIVNTATVAFSDQTGSQTTFTGTLSGAGAVSKIGGGTSMLNAGLTYTGATTVNAGTLGIAGSFTNSSGFTVNAGGALLARAGGATVNSLTLGTGAQTLAHNDGAGLSKLTVVNNNGLVANGTTTIDVGASNITVGTTVLVDYAGSIGGGGFGAFTLGTLPPRMLASLVNNTGNTSIDLNVTGFDLPRWHGNVSATWDINTTANWRTVNTNAATTYLQSTVPGDQVLFNDLAVGNTDVALNTTVQPSSVTYNNSTLGYTLSGTGKISGTTGLTKQGSNTVTISNTGGNDYTGPTNIQAGTLVVGVANALSDASTITISGGTLDLNALNVPRTGGVSLQGGTIANGTITKNNANYDLQSGTLAPTSVLSGSAGIAKSGAGTVVLTGTHTYTGSTSVNSGTLQLGDGTSNGQVPGGIANTGTVAFNPGLGGYAWIQNISGTGTVVKDGAETLFVTGVNEGPTILNAGTTVAIGPGGTSVVPRLGRGATVTINNGAILLAQGGHALGLNTANLPPSFVLNTGGNIHVDAGAELSLYNGTFAGGTITADPSSITLRLRGDYNVATNTSAMLSVPTAELFNAVGFTLASSSTLTISSNLSGATGMTGTGPGTIILSGSNSFTGNLSADNGALMLLSDAANIGAAGTLNILNAATVRTTASLGTAAQSLTGATGGGTFDTNGFDSTFAGGIGGAGPVTKAGAGALTVNGAIGRTGDTTLAGGTLVLDSPTNGSFAQITGLGGSLTKLNTNLITATRLEANNLIVESGILQVSNRATVGGIRTTRVNSLSLGATGTLDNNDHDLVVNNGVFTDIESQVLAGFGNPTAPGAITSSAATGVEILALFDNSLIGAGDWNGLPIGPNAIVGKYTYFGDANIDGQVTGDDYGVVDANLNTTPAVGLGWLSGDMNLDGSVTGDDYGVIDANLGLGVGNPLSASALGSMPAGSLSAVPEPSALAIVGANVGMLLARRRRVN